MQIQVLDTDSDDDESNAACALSRGSLPAPPSKDVYNVVLWLIPKIRRWRWQLLYLVPV